jgi:hypothetical protein
MVITSLNAPEQIGVQWGAAAGTTAGNYRPGVRRAAVGTGAINAESDELT